MVKICKKCEIEKDISCFRSRRDNKDGRAGDCNECRNKRRRNRYREQSESLLPKLRQKRTDDPNYFRNYELRRRHQITLEQFEKLFDKQGRVCAACGSEDSGELSPRTWHIDHDHSCCPGRKHTCGKCIRGVLCRWCNLSLGNAKDDPTRLRGLAVYLEMYKQNPHEAVT
jgi:hypothetical protein